MPFGMWQLKLERVVMSHVDAQRLFADLINKLGSTTLCCWWKLLGDEPNSISQLLDMPFADVRLTFRKCRILCGPADSFRTTEFEKLMVMCEIDYTTCRPSGKPECFLKIGDRTHDAHAILKPKLHCAKSYRPFELFANENCKL